MPMKIKKIENLNSPFDKVFQYLLSYLKNESLLPDEIKTIIRDESFFSVNPTYYMYYPYLFCLESLATKEFLMKLSVAGFLLYRSTLIQDDILDKKEGRGDSAIIANELQKEAIKILVTLFDKGSVFWQNWEQRKKEYFKGYKLDKSLIDLETFDEFVELCDYKSSIGKVAIDCIEAKFPNSMQFNKLYKSHQYFYVAFQILDDIEDINEDRQNKQFNIAYHELDCELKKREIFIADVEEENLKKYLHLTGVSNHLRKKALYYLNKAESIANDYGLKQWSSEIQKLHNTVISHILNTDGYIKYISKELSSPISNSIITVERAIKYIETNQNDDGSWNEILNSSGVSDVWATGFILYFISQKDVRKKIQPLCRKKATEFIEKQDGNWGYNLSWINDCDSSNFSLLGLHFNNKNIKRYIPEILKYQLASGGFITYNDIHALLSSLNQKEITSASGWTREHICVSSVAYYLLALLGSFPSEEKKVLNWITKQRNKKNKLADAYWWTSNIYNLVFILKGLLENREKNMSLIDEIVNELLQQQNANGSFGDLYVAQSPFYTGLVIDVLCDCSFIISEKLQPSIKKGIDWLVANQNEDGSWNPSYALRIPHPENIYPDNSQSWDISSFGTQIRAEDYNRLFSSVVALAAIRKHHSK